MDKIDLRNRGATSIDVSNLPGTIHPFMGSNKSLIQVFLHEVAGVLSHKQAKKIVGYAVCNFLVIVLLLLWCNGTDSMTLTAYTYLTIFDICRLLTCLMSLWVQQQKPTPIFSFGYERFEVLAVFASTILAQFGALFIMKESIERMVVQPEIHTGRLLVGTAVAFVFHLAVTYSMDNKAFNHIVSASSSSWLQEHVADMSESLCHFVPGLSKLLLPRINPFALIAAAGGVANIVTYILIDVNNYYSADTWAAVWIAVMTVGTMFPMSVYSGKILLQTTPSHMTGQLDKVLREASTLDGVLEFRHEHFWTLSFGRMAGSVHVRVRRDADEQLVLSHVVSRLSNLISVLTVQIFKDDWARTSAYQILGDSAVLNKLPASQTTSPLRSPVNLGPVGAAPWAAGPPSSSTSHLAGMPYAAGIGGLPSGLPSVGASVPRPILPNTPPQSTHFNLAMSNLGVSPGGTLPPAYSQGSFSPAIGGLGNLQKSPYAPGVSNGSYFPSPLDSSGSSTGSLRSPLLNPLYATTSAGSKLSTSAIRGSSANSFISDTLGGATNKTRTLDIKDTSKEH